MAGHSCSIRILCTHAERPDRGKYQLSARTIGNTVKFLRTHKNIAFDA
jgi:hypothetical protein